MTAILPSRIRVDLEFLMEGRARMMYQETFRGEHREGFVHAFEIVRKHFPDTTLEGDTITIRIEDDYQKVANFLVGEFLMASTLGEAKLRDLIVGAVVAGAGPKP